MEGAVLAATSVGFGIASTSGTVPGVLGLPMVGLGVLPKTMPKGAGVTGEAGGGVTGEADTGIFDGSFEGIWEIDGMLDSGSMEGMVLGAKLTDGDSLGA